MRQRCGAASPRTVGVWLLSGAMLWISTGGVALSAPPANPLHQPELTEEIYRLPKGSADDILMFLEELEELRPRLKKREEGLQHAIRVQQTIIDGTAQVLALPNVEIETAVEAAKRHLEAHNRLATGQVKGAVAKGLESAQKLAKDSRPEVASLAQAQLTSLRILNAPNLSAKDREALIQETFAKIKSENYSEQSVTNAMQMILSLEGMPEPEPLVDYLGALADLFDKAESPEVRQASQQLRGIARRITLPGNTMEVRGTTIEGKPFDMSAWKGKVILVDYWATWCNPCLAEIEHLKRLHAAYHAKGLEIVAINADDEKADVLEYLKENPVPWTVLFHETKNASERGLGMPLAVRYGVTQLPASMLIDANGKVVSVRALGKNLDDDLEKLLGPMKKDSPPSK